MTRYIDADVLMPSAGIERVELYTSIPTLTSQTRKWFI